MREYIRKMKSTSGMTLTETLTALAVAGLMSTVLVAGMNTALRVYQDATHLAESETVAETVILAVADEFRFASKTEISGNTCIYDSATFGKSSTMKCTEDGRIIVNAAGVDYRLLSDGVYDDLKVTEFEISANDDLVTISLSVGYEDKSYASQDVTVRMMNQE